jgi:hypothetical protein
LQLQRFLKGGAMAKKAKVKASILRAVQWGDTDGSIDHDFVDEDGFKRIQIRNANKGLIVTFYYGDAITAQQYYVSVESIADLLADQLPK